MQIVKWLEDNLIEHTFADKKVFIANEQSFLIIEPKSGLLFDESFQLILSDEEMEYADQIDYFTFCFGGKWYCFHKDEDPFLHSLKYIGKAKTNL